MTALLVALCAVPMVRAQVSGDPVVIGPRTVFADPPTDAVARRTDASASDSDLDVPYRLVDLLNIAVGYWDPDAPALDLFAGRFVNAGAFFRLDLRFRGVVNPPGSVDPFSFAPFRYGPRPVFGFVEIDMDEDIDTGGEMDAPQYRYLANVARFGGNVTLPGMRPRVALAGTAADDDPGTPPFVERSGEEFHLAFLGAEFPPQNVHFVVGDNDLHFEVGETWDITGTFFHRAHGYEPFSFAEGGSVPGEYMPRCTVRFDHNVQENVTRVSLVFPLTNLGAAMMRNRPVEANDQDPTNQASVLEALEDLTLSAKLLNQFPSDEPGAQMLSNWFDRDARRGLNVAAWRMTALLGTSYSLPDANAVRFVWTDVFPNVVRGDVDGSGRADLADATRVAAFIAESDDNDGLFDGRVRIPGFAANFSVADVNYDGFVDLEDIRLADRRGDDDDDGDIDLRDLARFQMCFGRDDADNAAQGCQRMDFTGDGLVDLEDLNELRGRLHGPGGP